MSVPSGCCLEQARKGHWEVRQLSAAPRVPAMGCGVCGVGAAAACPVQLARLSRGEGPRRLWLARALVFPEFSSAPHTLPWFHVTPLPPLTAAWAPRVL